MPRTRKYRFNDIHFNAYVHHYFLNVSTESLNNLSPEERRKVTNMKSLKKWCTDAPLEEKLIFLSKTGCDFQIILGGKEEVKNLIKMRGKDGVDVIDQMLKSKIFSLASASMLLSSYFIHQNSQSDEYLLNRNFQKIYTYWKIAQKNLGKWRTEADLKEIQYGFDFLLEVVFKTLRLKSIHAEVGLSNEIDLMILLYLMRKSVTVDNRVCFIEQSQVFAECSDGSKKQSSYTRRLRWLASNRFILKQKTTRFAIHDKGVMVVGELLKLIADKIRFTI